MIRLEMDVAAMLGAYQAKARAAEAALAAQVRDDCDAYVPYDTGALAGSACVTEGAVVYSAPYARFVYYGGGLRFRTDRHPMATAGWFEAAKAVHLEQWVQGARASMG